MIKYLLFLLTFSKAFSLDFGDPAMPNFYIYDDQIEGDYIEDIWERKIKCFLPNLHGDECKYTGTNKPQGSINVR